MKKTKKTALLLFIAVLAAFVTVFALATFAEKETVKRGDVNGDGLVDARDIILLQQYFAGYDYDKNEPPFEISEGADVNGDGHITTKDVLSLREYLAFEDGDTSIMEGNGTAAVLGRDGLKYWVSGYDSVENGLFIFDSGLEIVFEDGCFDLEFNRMCFEYESTEPIKVYVTYTLAGLEKTDYFFLEASKNSFRGLVEGYLKNKKGIELKKLTVDTCENVKAGFILHDLVTEVIPVYEDDLTVENERYKVGCRLSWGGAMTYFEDKQDGDDTLGNLVNIHDTGRLIQQSFYGTYTNGEYTSGKNPSGVTWPYNPVQGGDMKNNGSSRLVDVEVGEDYIYILTQPLDWAKPNYVTPLYYENTYTVKEDHVVVDNVATDFSGWKHVTGGQEIPAVYLVSYFDTLSYYNGIKPWTGDTEGVLYESNLQGWSNAGSFPLYRGNTETWSIWINTEDNFGFGTYCPNIQKHIAIRHQYNGSKDPMNNATSYVAPSCSITMQSYVPIEYSYILATGDPEEIREIFEENKDFADNASLSENRYDQLLTYGKFDMTNMDFTNPDYADIFYAPRHVNIGYDSTQNALKIYVENGSDPYASLNFDCNSDKLLSVSEYNTIEIEYMLPKTNSKASDTLQIFLNTGDNNSFKEEYTVKGNIVRDGKYHTLSISVPSAKFSGDYHKLRLDMFTSAKVGDVMYVKSIKLKCVEYPELQVDTDFGVERSEGIPESSNHTSLYYNEEAKALALKSTGGNDPYIMLDYTQLSLSTTQYKSLEVEYMVPVNNSFTKGYASVYFCTSDFDSIDGSQVVGCDSFIVDGNYHTMTFDFTQKAEFWSGDILQCRFDYFQHSSVAGDVMYIRRIRLVSVEGYEIELKADENGNFFADTAYTKVYPNENENENALILERSGGNDVWVKINLKNENLNTSDYSKMLIRYMVPKTNSQEKYGSVIYFSTSDYPSYGEDKTIYGLNLIKDGCYHTMIVDFSDETLWSGNIGTFRFDYFQSTSKDGDVIYIESIILIK